MRNKVKKTIEKYSMIEKGDRVVVGVSGGADSVSLLHVLKSFETEMEIEVCAVHVDHCLRGEESDRDREFTRNLCESMGVPLTIVQTDIRAEAKKRGCGLEEAGRAVRYAAFEKEAGESGKIATAHTLSDSVETVIFNMTRGCSVKGLCGIPPVRGQIIRPLIECTRTEIEEYISLNGLSYVNDSSNFKCDYSRNIIRLNVLPNLKKINPSVERTIGRMINSMRESEEYLETQARRLFEQSAVGDGLDINRLNEADDILLSRVLYLWLKDFDVENVHVELIKEAVRAQKGAVMIADNAIVKAEKNRLVISDGKSDEIQETDFEQPCHFDFTVLPTGKTVRFEIISKTEYFNRKKINNLFVNQCLDYDKINSNVVMRNRRSGDFFRAANRNCGKTVKKLLNEKKIPTAERGRLLFLECGGEIIWIEGLGSCENTKVEEKTQNVIVISIGV